MPEKYHGLQDVELRYRHRYVSLITNNEIKSTFKMRSKITHLIRSYLHDQDFMEVETPVLHNIYGGATAKPLIHFHNELEQNLFLRIALELHLKRLIVGGFEKVFEIGRVFRNEGLSYKHNPEYTLLELYEAYTDYNDMMQLTEQLISHIALKCPKGTTTFSYKRSNHRFNTSFKRLSLNEAIQNACGIDPNNIEELQLKANELKLDIPNNASKGHLIMEIYDKVVESTLINPTFIIDHPWETSPLAKQHRSMISLLSALS